MNWMNIPNTDSELHDLIRLPVKIDRHHRGVISYRACDRHAGFSANIHSPASGASLYMLVLVVSSLVLMQAQVSSIASCLVMRIDRRDRTGFFYFGQYEILDLLIVLPLLAVVTLGVPSAGASILVVVVIASILFRFADSPILFYGWYFSWQYIHHHLWLGTLKQPSGFPGGSLVSLQRSAPPVGETQNHQAEIGRMLKDRNQVNYQLERMNEMLKFSRAQAEEARENRNRFMLAVSHELRSPLNFIIGFSDLMVNAPETYAPLSGWPSGLYEDVQEIYTSSKHLMRLINDILDMGQNGCRAMTLYREKTQIYQIVADVRDMLAGAFEQKGISFQLNSLQTCHQFLSIRPASGRFLSFAQ